MKEHTDIAEILSSFKDRQGRSSELLPILQEVQARIGYIPQEAMDKVAEFCGITESEAFGVASFYAQFRFVPVGKTQVTICRGTACHVRGAAGILDEAKRVLGIEEGQTTADLEYSLEAVACIGCCALAPCMAISGSVEANLTPQKTRELLTRGTQE